MKRLLLVAAMGLAMGAALGAIFTLRAHNTTEEVRVVARSASDGRIEFGIEHDGERVLPTGRYMSAAQIGARNDKWLRSTPVQIEVAADEIITSASGRGNGEFTYAAAAGWHFCAAAIGATAAERPDFEVRKSQAFDGALFGGNTWDSGAGFTSNTTFNVPFARAFEMVVYANSDRPWAIGCVRVPITDR